MRLQFPHGVLREELFLGIVSTVEAQRCLVNLSEADASSGWHFEAHRYGRGEVGELILIEAQTRVFLGRIVAVRLAERDRMVLGTATDRSLDAIGEVQFLGTLRMDDLGVEVGMSAYPRLGDRCFAATRELVAQLPSLAAPENDGVALPFARIGLNGPTIAVSPSRLFGRHCAVLGATGGGKSYTIARLIQEALRLEARAILLDATGEYSSIEDASVRHAHLGEPTSMASGSRPVRLPPTDFVESDFLALFEPAGKVQGPKLQEAIRSLRLAHAVNANSDPDVGQPPYGKYFVNGLIVKRNLEKKPLAILQKRYANEIEDPSHPFDVGQLVAQLNHECLYLDRFDNAAQWGDFDQNSLSLVLPLRTRINAILSSPAFRPVFDDTASSTVAKEVSALLESTSGALRICMGGVAYEYRVRELIANAIGRHLLGLARQGRFRDRPLIVFVDEAHNFMGKAIGQEGAAVRLDAFELIAREGRKYGLLLCLATQRPRDLTEGVLSQIGTMIVHRLTNDRDREVVERASGELDRRAAAFLPGLAPGEAVFVGADLPIPLTIHVEIPKWRPVSLGPSFASVHPG